MRSYNVNGYNVNSVIVIVSLSYFCHISLKIIFRYSISGRRNQAEIITEDVMSELVYRALYSLYTNVPQTISVKVNKCFSVGFRYLSG